MKIIYTDYANDINNAVKTVSKEDDEKILNIIAEYFQKGNISCGESIMQMDNNYIGAVETMIDICEIIFGE